MAIRVAIVADDLTGALDTGTPFVDAGLTVAVALDGDAVEAAIATGAEVIVVNTVSRALDPFEAADRIKQATAALCHASPEFVLKKIDSRLKGNVATESEALALAFGRHRLLIAPAVPDQQRHTREAHVVGFGVPEPLAIAPLFSDSGIEVQIADAASDDDLDGIVESLDWSAAIAVGARGLGRALARRLAEPSAPRYFKTSPRTLFAFGSRDPITEAQMEELLDSGLVASHRDAPAGDVPGEGEPARLPMLLRCTGALTGAQKAVAQRFGEGVSRIVATTLPDMLMMGGGDTAYAILRSLGSRVLLPKGEIEAGIPWFETTRPDGRRMRCAVKSGGFGNAQSLLKVLQNEQDG
ncbi:four-carbon acid sugar kinase family protein [Sinorhizobium fredii]|uniref:four-carbon acid sugar kinase family protein n=1 Tax=Rhizobium fredii TaxID=380 RepID=UPI0005955DF9|nr:four-carbon acid sugar kinase family protein [Sinorhizobium fredii]WOS66608.1 four-carbon acid sugar kinase family protein [Sinorhizobium fredii GR64]